MSMVGLSVIVIPFWVVGLLDLVVGYYFRSKVGNSCGHNDHVSIVATGHFIAHLCRGRYVHFVQHRTGFAEQRDQ